ncbi:hypothetical protein RFI_16332 [Reticulomyxa filosa]|uniref:C3H1-type domain-containing protein n=1 Tax=Reticulomyxa filosa TaxID=46433 RepID=X6N4G6_RETFI|nr:hypothetical protein RFI_16332 [Reticulomyxa filosa]|eukprot:ETO20876.1 hypothetical protein RFI_16332 [Reticulomyxa filosa]
MALNIFFSYMLKKKKKKKKKKKVGSKKDEKIDKSVYVEEKRNGIKIVYGWYEPLTELEKRQLCWDWKRGCKRGSECNWRHWDEQYKRDMLTRWRPTGFFFHSDTSVNSKSEFPSRHYPPTQNASISDEPYSTKRRPYSMKKSPFGKSKYSHSSQQIPQNTRPVLNNQSDETQNVELMKSVITQVHSSLKQMTKHESSEADMDKIFQLFEPISFVGYIWSDLTKFIWSQKKKKKKEFIQIC